MVRMHQTLVIETCHVLTTHLTESLEIFYLDPFDKKNNNKKAS